MYCYVWFTFLSTHTVPCLWTNLYVCVFIHQSYVLNSASRYMCMPIFDCMFVYLVGWWAFFTSLCWRSRKKLRLSETGHNNFWRMKNRFWCSFVQWKRSQQICSFHLSQLFVSRSSGRIELIKNLSLFLSLVKQRYGTPTWAPFSFISDQTASQNSVIKW